MRLIMAIESYELIKIGRRCNVTYIFSDGRRIPIGGFNADSQTDADNKAIAHQQGVLKSVAESDAEEAVRNDIKIAYKEAALKNVQYAWVKAGFTSDNILDMYYHLKQFVPQLIALNWTNQQLADYFDTTVDRIEKTKSIWSQIKDYPRELDALRIIQDGL